MESCSYAIDLADDVYLWSMIFLCKNFPSGSLGLMFVTTLSFLTVTCLLGVDFLYSLWLFFLQSVHVDIGRWPQIRVGYLLEMVGPFSIY